jgi:hypothetical protein
LQDPSSQVAVQCLQNIIEIISDLETEEKKERKVAYQFLDVENHDFVSNG